mmetsp:Transcript_14961/g.20395  ORF Transcript_14961/g.20395 Transcript_14961/m.20395 type:complete len:114 (-) Transcript_14961:2688-3029(-)
MVSSGVPTSKCPVLHELSVVSHGVSFSGSLSKSSTTVHSKDTRLGFIDGLMEGILDGRFDDSRDGMADGSVDGLELGMFDGSLDGKADGTTETDGLVDILGILESLEGRMDGS